MKTREAFPRYELLTLPAGIAASLPFELWQVYQDAMEMHATQAGRSEAIKEKRAQYDRALTAAQQKRYGYAE